MGTPALASVHIGVMRLLVIISAALFRENVATRSRRLRAAAQGMSVESAVGILQRSKSKHMSKELLSVVEDQAGHWSLAKRTTNGLLGVIPKPAAGADYGKGLHKAVIRINAMKLETIQQNDTETLRCTELFREQNRLLVEIGQDLDYFSMAANDAFSKVQHAENSISSTLALVKSTADELEKHRSGCEDQKSDLHYQLHVVTGDQGVMTRVLEMTKCSDAASNGQFLLLQCADANSGRRFTRLQARSRELREQLGLLKHARSRELVESQVITTDLSVDDETAAESEVFLQTKRDASDSEPPPPPEYVYMGPGGEQSRCSISDSSSCPELREKFMNIAGGIEDAKEEINFMLGNLDVSCKETTRLLQLEQRHYDFFHRQQEKALAFASASRSAAYQSVNLKQVELREVEARLAAETKKCNRMFEEFESQDCALTKIRGQLLHMENVEPHIIDCHMATWEEGECSQSCGGGKRVLTRKIEQFPGPGPEEYRSGHKCPISEAVVTCNEDRCPVDCLLGDWSDWGACSRLCDGGFQERSRLKRRHPSGGGEQCETEMDSQQCNADLCNADCELSVWSEWSTTCSRQCGGGQQTRVKTLVAPPRGMGQCPHFYDPLRYDKKSCNTMRCPYTNSVATCVSMVDVILLIDGSASMRTVGFNAAKTTAAKFSRSLAGKARVAALLFSGPDDFSTFDQCEGLAAGDPTLQQCGMIWVKHLTGDYESVAQGVEALAHPQSTALMSLALDTCEQEFTQFGRQAAHSVVVIFTDGAPISKLKMSAAADRLNNKAQVVTALVGAEASADFSDFERWVSRPWQDNLEIVQEWGTLSDNATINHLISDFCSNMDFLQR